MKPSKKYGWWVAPFHHTVAHTICGIQDGDETSIYDSAQALHTLQKLFGLFPRIIGKGDCAGVSSNVLRASHRLIIRSG
jgi:hypothetical protein